MESEKTGPLFKKEQDYARATTSAWIAHPAVRSALDIVRPAAVAATATLLPYMTNQIQTMRFCWRMCGIGPIYPDGSEEPNPFDPDGPEPWPLTDQERTNAGWFAALFHRLVLAIASDLAGKGVQLDPEWGGDQAVLAVLLLLPVIGYEIPWDGPIDEFADAIQPPGVSAITRDGRSVSARDGRPDTMARNADRIRKIIRDDNGGRDLRAPYAGASRRALPRTTQIRREILSAILAENPGVTVGRILVTYDHSNRTIGGRLRHELTARSRQEGLPTPNKPSQTTLFDDFVQIRAAATGSESAGERPSG